jgi:glutathione S-transferase
MSLHLYNMPDSGNSYKVRLLLAHLGRSFTTTDVATDGKDTRTAAYRARYPKAKAPLLELADGTLIGESNAIMFYLAQNTVFLPADPVGQAKVLEWLFFEQSAHEINIAVRRSLHVYPFRAHLATEERLAATLEGGNAALTVMDTALETLPFLVGDPLTIADISLYPYTSQAADGGFDLDDYPAVKKWLRRVSSQQGHVPIEWTPGR